MHKQHKKIEDFFGKLQEKQGSKFKTDQIKCELTNKPRLYEEPCSKDDMTKCCIRNPINMFNKRNKYIRYTDGYAR